MHYFGIEYLTVNVARFTIYQLIVTKSIHLIYLLYKEFVQNERSKFFHFVEANKKGLTAGLASFILLRFLELEIIEINIFPFIIASLIVQYLDMEKAKSNDIGYGAGMACSYFEGYLALILPSDGSKFFGFEENISVFEARNKVNFPVKKLFIIVTKSLYSPPDLKQFNKTDRDLPFLEACESLEGIMRDQAGVKNRIYRNSCYKIHRKDKKNVYLAVECATPLHTLHKVKEKKGLYGDLAHADFDYIVKDFCDMLKKILDESRECYGNCEIVFFDDTDPKLNLAQVLLDTIEKLEPKFEEIINRVD